MEFGSVTELTAACRGRHVVVGSHGGPITARYALACGVASVICHDAGIGLDEAGVRALALLQAAGVPAAAVAHHSARIGDPRDMLARGRISRVNAAAAELGAAAGMAAGQVAAQFAEASPRTVPSVASAAFVPGRYPLGDGVTGLDSAAELDARDDGALIVTGSHGGLPGADSHRAAKARPHFIAFNDAGRGADDAGVARLPVLAEQGIAAVAVDAFTARIGDARSSWETGVVSAVNAVARALGAAEGMPLQAVLAAVRRTGEDG